MDVGPVPGSAGETRPRPEVGAGRGRGAGVLWQKRDLSTKRNPKLTALAGLSHRGWAVGTLVSIPEVLRPSVTRARGDVCRLLSVSRSSPESVAETPGLPRTSRTGVTGGQDPVVTTGSAWVGVLRAPVEVQSLKSPTPTGRRLCLCPGLRRRIPGLHTPPTLNRGVRGGVEDGGFEVGDLGLGVRWASVPRGNPGRVLGVAAVGARVPPGGTRAIASHTAGPGGTTVSGGARTR